MVVVKEIVALLALVSIPSAGATADEVDRPHESCSVPEFYQNAHSQSGELLDFYEHFSGMRPAVLAPPKAEYLISRAEFMALPHAITVDLRAEDYFAHSSLPGAINIESRVLSSKKFLKAASVVLLDHSYKLQDSIALCRVLHKKGFQSVQVLDFTLAEIESFNGKNALARPPITQLSANDFYISPDKAQWLVVDFSDSSAHASLHHIALNKDSTLKEQRDHLDAAITAYKRVYSVKPKLFLLTKDEPGLEAFGKIRKVYGDFDWYSLKGGLAGYRQFIETSRTVMHNKGRESVGGVPLCAS